MPTVCSRDVERRSGVEVWWVGVTGDVAPDGVMGSVSSGVSGTEGDSRAKSREAFMFVAAVDYGGRGSRTDSKGRCNWCEDAVLRLGCTGCRRCSGERYDFFQFSGERRDGFRWTRLRRQMVNKDGDKCRLWREGEREKGEGEEMEESRKVKSGSRRTR